MPDVPFLLVYGAWIWKAALLALALGIGGAMWAWQRRRARYDALVIAEGLDIGGDGCVRGRLGGPGAGALASAVHAEPREGVPFTGYWRARTLWIETPDGRILLEGPVQVLAGSRAAAAENGVPAEFSDEALRDNAAEAPWLHRKLPGRRAAVRSASALTLSAGDEVVACGEHLERGPAAAAANYREGHGEWRLTGSAHAPIRIAARTPSGGAQPVSYRSIAFVLLLVIPAAYALAWVVGTRLQNACGESRDPDVSNTDACVLAAALPHQETEAREQLHERLRKLPVRDEADYQARVAVAELVGGCRSVATVALNHERYEDGARAAHACAPANERLALALQGRFEEAAAIDVRDELTPILLIAAGHWKEAADAVGKTPVPEPAHGGSSASRQRFQQCLGELLRHHGGDRAALERLRALGGENNEGNCGLVAMIADERDRSVAGRPFALARAAIDSLPSRWSGILTTYDGRAVSDARAELVWVVGPNPGPLVDTLSKEERARLLRWAAIAQLLDGDLLAAQRTLTDFASATDDDTDDVAFSMLDYPIDPLGERLRAMMFWALTGNYSEIARYSYTGLESDAYYTAVMLAEVTHDGAPFAQALETAHPPWQHLDTLRVWPKLTTGRDAVAQRLIWRASRFTDAAAQLRRPATWAAYAALRRTTFTAIGATDEAARWSEIYKRFDAVLSDRAKLVAIMLASW